MTIEIVPNDKGNPPGKRSEHADVVIAPESTIHLFHLVTRRAERWVKEHVDPSAQWFGGALVIEHRYASDLARGLAGDGLHVRVSGSGWP